MALPWRGWRSQRRAPLHLPRRHVSLPLPLSSFLPARLEELDSARFTKLCRECGLLCRRFTPGYADVAFTAAKKRKELRKWVICM